MSLDEDEKIKKFLSKGYLPVQLPPGFNSDSFAKEYQSFSWEFKKDLRCRSEKFSVARSSYYRRVTSIVNPVAYFFLVKEIVKHWGEIEKHYDSRNEETFISLSQPKFESSLRAIEICKFSKLYENKITRSAGFKYVLLTDISRFFPTIYTHSIPWALHTKKVAKENRNCETQYYGNCIDEKSRAIQDGQTIGLPIGPDTSHIIAEIIATAIDKELKDSVGEKLHGFRYVDDYCLFFNSQEEAQKVLAKLSQVLTQYELQINPSKTRIIEVKDLIEESWKYNVKKLEISSKIHKQRDDIHNYFESLFTLEKRFKDESLVKYGLKKISTKIIKKDNWNIYEAYLLKCGYAFPNTLQTITTIFSTYNEYNYPITTKAIERFCNNLIQEHSISESHSEIAWALWLAKELKIQINKQSIQSVISSSSSVCKLILLDLINNNSIEYKNTVNDIKQLLEENMKPFAKKEALYEENWLLAYEGGRRKWLYNENTLYIENDEFFSKLLKEKNVSFYDEQKKCPPVFKLKKDEEDELALAKFLEENLNNDENIDEYFEFNEGEEEYFDAEEGEVSHSSEEAE